MNLPISILNLWVAMWMELQSFSDLVNVLLVISVDHMAKLEVLKTLLEVSVPSMDNALYSVPKFKVLACLSFSHVKIILSGFQFLKIAKHSKKGHITWIRYWAVFSKCGYWNLLLWWSSGRSWSSSNQDFQSLFQSLRWYVEKDYSAWSWSSESKDEALRLEFPSLPKFPRDASSKFLCSFFSQFLQKKCFS